MRATALAVVIATVFLGLPAAADQPDVAPLMLGQPAPWSGLLVRELRFSKMLKLQLDLDELSKKSQLREQLFTSSTAMLQAQLDKAQADLTRLLKPEPWYKSRSFLFCLGVFLGLAVSLSAIPALK